METLTKQDTTIVELNRAALEAMVAITNATSTEQGRPILNGVLVELREDGIVRMAATDSYLLAVRTFRTIVDGNLRSVILPAKDLADAAKALLKSAPKYAPSAAWFADITDTHVTFRSADGSRTLRTIDGRFPDYSSLIPTTFGELQTIGLAPHRITTVAKALGCTFKGSGSDAGTKITFQNADKCCRVEKLSELDKEGNFGLIMPIRLHN